MTDKQWTGMLQMVYAIIRNAPTKEAAEKEIAALIEGTFEEPEKRC